MNGIHVFNVDKSKLLILKQFLLPSDCYTIRIEMHGLPLTTMCVFEYIYYFLYYSQI